MLAEENLPDNALIAEGDNSFAVYDSAVNLRMTQKPGQTREDSLICVFTGRKEAEQVRTDFLQYGNDDSVIVITCDELYSHAIQCGGIIIDMPTYGLELSKEAFQDIANWRVVPGIIQVKLGDDDE